MPAIATANEQVIEAVISGPDGADRLYTCTGQALVNWQVASNQNRRETWTFLVGPALPHPQFHRATASVSVAAYAVANEWMFDPMMTGNAWHSLDFQTVEADWDDESGQTEMHVEVAIATGSVWFTLAKIGYTVTVLAEAPAA